MSINPGWILILEEDLPSSLLRIERIQLVLYFRYLRPQSETKSMETGVLNHRILLINKQMLRYPNVKSDPSRHVKKTKCNTTNPRLHSNDSPIGSDQHRTYRNDSTDPGVDLTDPERGRCTREVYDKVGGPPVRSEEVSHRHKVLSFSILTFRRTLVPNFQCVTMKTVITSLT